VEMENERGETFRADKITISVAEDWLEAEGALASRFLVEEEEAADEGEEEGVEAEGSSAEPESGQQAEEVSQ